jgi:hypothetical protein
MAQASAAPGATNVPKDDQGIGLDFAAVTKYGAASVALAYATGMLTVNTYLHKLGITDFSFAKPKLILTGVLVLLTFLLLGALPISVAWRMADSTQPARPYSRKILLPLLLPLVVLFAASAALCFREAPGLGQIAVWDVWELLKLTGPRLRTVAKESLASLIIAAEVYLPICVAALSAFTAGLLFKRAKSRKRHLVPERVYYPIVLSLAAVAVVGYIYFFR